MKREKIANYFYFQEGPGVRNTQYTTEGVKLLNVANLRDGQIDLSNTERYISVEEAYGKYARFLVDEGDFIIASSGIKVEYFDKKMGFAKKEHLPLCMNTSTIRFKALNENETDIRYFMYYLKSNSFKAQLAEFITGSAQLNFGPSHLKKMTFPLIDLAQQKEIVDVLSKIDALLIIKNKQLEKIDSLVKAKFYEMFGDRLYNNKGWKIKPLSECADFYNGKAHEQVIDNNGKYILVTSRCIASDFLDYRKTNVQLFPLRKNDIVMVMSDVPNGRAFAKCQIIDKDDFYTLNQRICCFRNYDFNPTFFFWLLNRHEYFLQFDNGDSQTNLRKNDLLACNVILPPRELQDEFAHFVEQTEKIKTTIKLSLEKLELLKQSLLQKYFG